MKPARLPIMILGCVALLLSVVGCGKDEPQKSGSASKATTQEPAVTVDTRSSTASPPDTQRPTADSSGRRQAPAPSGESIDVAPKKQEQEDFLRFGDGYCRIIEDSFGLYIGPETGFDAYVEEIEGRPVQRAKLSKDNSIPSGVLAVQLLTRDKSPQGAPRDLKLVASKWNEARQTIDLTFSDETISVLVHTTYDLRGFTFHGFEVKALSEEKSRKFEGSIDGLQWQAGLPISASTWKETIIRLKEYPEHAFYMSAALSKKHGFEPPGILANIQAENLTGTRVRMTCTAMPSEEGKPSGEKEYRVVSYEVMK